MEEFGFTNPILIDGAGTIIAGHARFEAAKLLGLAKIPCLILDHMTEAQQRAYVIADNQLATNASWDMDVLKTELQFLKMQDFKMPTLGFDISDIEKWTLPKMIEEDNEHAANNPPKGNVEPKDYGEGQELDQSQFDSFSSQCPKCGFEFGAK